METQQMKPNKTFWVSANYFALFAGTGAFHPFLSLYLRNSGWSGSEIGVYLAIGPLVALISQPLWGLLCDALGNTKRVFTALLLLTGATAFVYAFVEPTTAFFGLAVLLGVFQ